MKTQRKSNYIVYQEPARYDIWIIVLLVGIVLMELSIGIVVYFTDPEALYVSFASVMLLVLIFYLVLPRRYEIYTDHLRIVLGWPISMNIPFTTIREIKPADSYESWVFWGMKFATSAKTAIVIIRSKGISVVISPYDKNKFTDRLLQAMKGT